MPGMLRRAATPQGPLLDAQLGQHPGIDRIGLGALPPQLGKAATEEGIDHAQGGAQGG